MEDILARKIELLSLWHTSRGIPGAQIRKKPEAVSTPVWTKLRSARECELVYIATALQDDELTLLLRMHEAMGFKEDTATIFLLSGKPDLEILQKEVRAAKAIVLLGMEVASQLLGWNESKWKQHWGKFQPLDPLKVLTFPLLHPHELITNPSRKRDAWQAMQLLISVVEKPTPST